MLAKLTKSFFGKRAATFTTAMTVNEVERLLSKNVSSLIQQSALSDGLVGRVKRDDVVIFRYQPFGRIGGFPGTMKFRGRLRKNNGNTSLEGVFQLSIIGRVFVVFWLFFATAISGWMFALYFLGATTTAEPAFEKIVIAAVVLVVGFVFLFRDSQRFERDVKAISASIAEILRTPINGVSFD